MQARNTLLLLRNERVETDAVGMSTDVVEEHRSLHGEERKRRLWTLSRSDEVICLSISCVFFYFLDTNNRLCAVKYELYFAVTASTQAYKVTNGREKRT